MVYNTKVRKMPIVEIALRLVVVPEIYSDLYTISKGLVFLSNSRISLSTKGSLSSCPSREQRNCSLSKLSTILKTEYRGHVVLFSVGGYVSVTKMKNKVRLVAPFEGTTK